MHIPLLQDLLILLGFSVIVVFIFQKFKLPSILGFLVTGIIIGPHGLSLVNAIDEVEVLSEIGVILLLFVIGMELSLKQLVSMRKTVFIGGFLQVGLTAVVTFVIYFFLGYEWNVAVFTGFLFSLSSTAIVLKLLQDRNELTTPHGRNALGILIFQDIIVVPMMLVTPILAGQTTNVGGAVLDLVVKSGLVLLVTYVSARYLIPRLMYLIAKTKSKELFLLTTIAICFAVAFLTSEAGLSLALGAFLAGLIISESEYSHQATSTILPFRELFTSFFFISVGMLLDLSFLLQHIWQVLLMLVAVLIVKSILTAIAVAILKYPFRTVVLTGLALFQIGEFAFILSKVGVENNLLTDEMNQYFLSASILTMMLTPFVMMYSDRFSIMLSRSKFQQKFLSGSQTMPASEEAGHEDLKDHLVIIGYGINGRNVARAARYADIPYIIIELSANTVREEKAKGENIIFGDALHDHILNEVGITKARVVVVAISDPNAIKSIVSSIRSMTQSAYLIVRTRYVKEIDLLITLGADEVIPEEFETSIEIFSRVLQNFLVPMDELDKLVNAIRSDNYELFRPKNSLRQGVSPARVPELRIVSIRVLCDSGELLRKTISEVDVRNNYGVNILAISRDSIVIQSIKPDERLQQNDLVFVSGDQEDIEKFYNAVT